MAKATKKNIAEYVNKHGIEEFDFSSLLSCFDENDILLNIADHDKNPGFFIYSEHYQRDKLVLNVKTYFGSKEPFEAIPKFLNDLGITEQVFENYVSRVANDSNLYLYQENFDDWQSEAKFKCDFVVAGKSGGYWGIENFNEYELFEPCENKNIIEGLKKHLLIKFEDIEFEDKDEMYSEFQESISELCNVSNYEQEGHLNYVRNDLGLIKFKDDFFKDLEHLAEDAYLRKESYSYKPNLVEDLIYNTSLIPEDEVDNVAVKYSNYCFEEELKLLNVELNQNYDFSFKTYDNKNIEFKIDTKFANKEQNLATINVKVDGVEYNDSHKNIQINGKNLGFYLEKKENVKDTFINIKELLDFKSIIENKNHVFEDKKLVSIIGVIKPENIKNDLILKQKLSLNKNNEFELKTNLYLFDNINKSSEKICIKKGKFDLENIKDDIRQITQYNYRVEEQLKKEKNPDYDYYNSLNRYSRNTIFEVEKGLKCFDNLNQISPIVKCTSKNDIKSQDYRIGYFERDIKTSRLACFSIPNEKVFIAPAKTKNKEEIGFNNI